MSRHYSPPMPDAAAALEYLIYRGMHQQYASDSVALTERLALQTGEQRYIDWAGVRVAPIVGREAGATVIRRWMSWPIDD
jgi:hypothetical protein